MLVLEASHCMDLFDNAESEFVPVLLFLFLLIPCTSGCVSTPLLLCIRVCHTPNCVVYSVTSCVYTGQTQRVPPLRRTAGAAETSHSPGPDRSLMKTHFPARLQLLLLLVRPLLKLLLVPFFFFFYPPSFASLSAYHMTKQTPVADDHLGGGVGGFVQGCWFSLTSVIIWEMVSAVLTPPLSHISHVGSQ